MNRMPERGKCFGNQLIGTLSLNKKVPKGNLAIRLRDKYTLNFTT